MKKIGILGGLAWPSTVEYYAGLCRLAEAHRTTRGRSGTFEMPEIAIESLDITTAVTLIGDDGDEASWAAFDTYHRAGLQRLERSSAAFAVIACNTAHHRFAQITRGIGIPVLNIVEIAAMACTRMRLHRLLILGTAAVMQSAVFRATLDQYGVKATAPHDENDRRTIIATIAALQRGRIAGEAERIHAVAARNRPQQTEGMAVYLGCTELPSAFPAHRQQVMFEAGGIRYVNSAALHIRAAFEYAIEGS